MARMTIIETPVELTNLSLEEFEGMLGDEYLHIKCCRVDRFYCGHPFHPELVITPETSEDEVCLECVDAKADHQCWRGHQHCPIPLLVGFVCPRV